MQISLATIAFIPLVYFDSASAASIETKSAYLGLKGGANSKSNSYDFYEAWRNLETKFDGENDGPLRESKTKTLISQQGYSISTDPWNSSYRSKSDKDLPHRDTAPFELQDDNGRFYQENYEKMVKVFGPPYNKDAHEDMIKNAYTATRGSSEDFLNLNNPDDANNMIWVSANKDEINKIADQYQDIDITDPFEQFSKQGIRSEWLQQHILGLLIQYTDIVKIFTTDSGTTLNSNVVYLLKQLGVGVLGVNGNRGMWTYLTETELPHIVTNWYPINSSNFLMLNELANATGWTLSLGAPLPKDPAYTVEFITKGILKYIDANNLDSIELGNEPDHFSLESKSMRDQGFYFTDYMKEISEIIAALKIDPTFIAKSPKLQAPAVAGCNTYVGGVSQDKCWLGFIGDLAEQTPDFVQKISYHRYSQSGCSIKLTESDKLNALLRDMDPANGHFYWARSIRKKLRQLGKTLVASETNAFSCGGIDGLSNSFAAALSNLDHFCENILNGATSVALFSDENQSMSPFVVIDGALKINANYYPLAQFTRLLGTDKTRIYRANVFSGIYSNNFWKTDAFGIYTKAYYFESVNKDNITDTHILFINKDPKPKYDEYEINFNVDNGKIYKNAYVTRFEADDSGSGKRLQYFETADDPSSKSFYYPGHVTETEAIYLAGQTFRDQSGDGKASGSFTSEHPSVKNGKYYSVKMRAFSAVVLSLSDSEIITNKGFQ